MAIPNAAHITTVPIMLNTINSPSAFLEPGPSGSIFFLS